MQELKVAITFNFFAWPLTGGVADIDVQYRLLTANAATSSYDSSAVAITGTAVMAATTIVESMQNEMVTIF